MMCMYVYLSICVCIYMLLHVSGECVYTNVKFKFQITLLHYNVLHSQTEFDPVTDHSLSSDQIYTNTPSPKGYPMHNYI